MSRKVSGAWLYDWVILMTACYTERLGDQSHSPQWPEKASRKPESFVFQLARLNELRLLNLSAHTK